VAAKDAALTPRPVRREQGDDTTPWGKPAPRRQPQRDAAVQEPTEVAAPASVPTPAVVAEPISLDAARSVRSRRALRWAAGAAAAAAVVIAAVVVPARGSVDPPVPEFAGAHSVRSSVTDDPVMQLATAPLAFGR
jgi:hypothetical protein